MEISGEKWNILFNSRSGLSVGFALALSTVSRNSRNYLKIDEKVAYKIIFLDEF